jgi:hypothetical protein
MHSVGPHNRTYSLDSISTPDSKKSLGGRLITSINNNPNNCVYALYALIVTASALLFAGYHLDSVLDNKIIFSSVLMAAYVAPLIINRFLNKYREIKDAGGTIIKFERSGSFTTIHTKNILQAKKAASAIHKANEAVIKDLIGERR